MTQPIIMWQVVETKIVYDRRTQEREVDAHVGNLYAEKRVAENEAEGKREAWERALEEWEDDPHRCIYYEAFRVDVREKHLSIHQLKKAERMDEDRHETMMDAVNAVGASLLADEGIGPLAGDGR